MAQVTQGTLHFGLSRPAAGESRCGGYSEPCPRCGAAVPEQERGGQPKVYCSRDCQRSAWDKRNPRVPAENRGKRTRAEKILDRLRQGKATGLELLQAGGGTRYGARILELRLEGKRIHGPLEWIEGFGRYRLEPIPKTDDGHELYELREGNHG